MRAWLPRDGRSASSQPLLKRVRGTTMTAPTPQDAQLVVQLAQLAAVQGLDKAVAWLFDHKMPTDPVAFRERYPAGSKGHRHAAAVLTYMETIGALWKHGLVSEDLLFDWLWV